MTGTVTPATQGGFQHVPGVKAGVIIELVEKYMVDPNPDKISLNAGTYRDGDGQPYILPSVKLATERTRLATSYSHEYLGMSGLPKFITGSQELVFGSPADLDCIASIQTIGGTGACHLGAAFLQEWYHPHRSVYISDPSWENHQGIFEHVGRQTELYPYWRADKLDIDFEGMCTTLRSASPGSIIVLHACGHNPTGADLSSDQWRTLADVMSLRGHFAFFDLAYQGFVSGCLELDAGAIRLFVERGIPLLVAQSFSKNAGLYGERLGALHIVCHSREAASLVSSQLRFLNRREVSSAPRHGADIMSIIFSDKALRDQWDQDMSRMANRITNIRLRLVELLRELNTPGNWDHITKQRGMFAYTGLRAAQCDYLTRSHSIYVPPTGRISVAGLNENNIRRIAEAIDYVVRNIS